MGGPRTRAYFPQWELPCSRGHRPAPYLSYAYACILQKYLHLLVSYRWVLSGATPCGRLRATRTIDWINVIGQRAER